MTRRSQVEESHAPYVEAYVTLGRIARPKVGSVLGYNYPSTRMVMRTRISFSLITRRSRRRDQQNLVKRGYFDRHPERLS